MKLIKRFLFALAFVAAIFGLIFGIFYFFHLTEPWGAVAFLVTVLGGIGWLISKDFVD